MQFAGNNVDFSHKATGWRAMMTQCPLLRPRVCFVNELLLRQQQRAMTMADEVVPSTSEIMTWLHMIRADVSMKS